jgi:hypothetical protein
MKLARATAQIPRTTQGRRALEAASEFGAESAHRGDLSRATRSDTGLPDALNFL